MIGAMLLSPIAPAAAQETGDGKVVLAVDAAMANRNHVIVGVVALLATLLASGGAVIFLWLWLTLGDPVVAGVVMATTLLPVLPMVSPAVAGPVRVPDDAHFEAQVLEDF